MSLISTATTVLQKLTDHQEIAIFGLGKEGFSTYQFLRAHLPLASIFLTDDKEVTQLDENWQAVLASDDNLQFFPSASFIQHLSSEKSLFLIKTPGIPRTNALFAHLKNHPHALSSNTELFFAVLNEIPQEQQPKTIGITGTKGKSTTTALIHHVLKEAGVSVFLAGNIGVPPLEVLTEMETLSDEKIAQSTVALEMSSHQLRELSFSPQIAVVQNITPEHLDYYENFEEYWQAKGMIARFQRPTDMVIYNPDFEFPSVIAATSPARKVTFRINAQSPGLTASTHDGAIFYRNEKVIDQAQLPLMGEHNLLNTLPAVIIGKEYEISTEIIAKALTSFHSLPHRLEFVAEKNGVTYYNDSQGTTPEAACAAITSFPGKNIILLAGGSDKGVEFDELARIILQNTVTTILLFPPTGKKIAQALLTAQETALAHQDIYAAHEPVAPQVTQVASMQEAVSLAEKAATPGSVVLLSPACASFGLFKNYQDRGNQFKEAVLRSISPATPK